MSVLKQVIRLKQQGKSIKKTSLLLGISKNTTKKYLQQIETNRWDENWLLSLDDERLEGLFMSAVQKDKHRQEGLSELLPGIESELARTGVNRWVLWGEYRSKNPGGYSYSQFCFHIQEYLKSNHAVMHFEHLPGDKLFIDFTGKKLCYVERQTGEQIDVEVFVSTLGFSQLTYVEATRSQQQEDFIMATQNALHYYGGTPQVLVCDNLKAGVTKASKYEAEINRSYLEMANHYGTTILPTRSRKPRDKALVEKHVSIVYSRIFAPLRDKEFYSLEGLNEAILELQDAHNRLPFQGQKTSRVERFNQEEKGTLKPLPEERYEIREYLSLKVMTNSHIQLRKDKHYYSVPFRYIGKQVTVICTERNVSIYCDNERIAFHQRNYREYKYTTIPEHVPSTHRFMTEWNPDRFIQWATSMDPVIAEYIKNILEQKAYPEQAYRSCLGILSMAKKFGKDRLINACKRAIFYNVYNYTMIDQIIRNNQDLLPLETESSGQQKLPFHENIRGVSYYQQ